MLSFQMSKMGLQKEKELEIKLPTFSGLKRKQGKFRKKKKHLSLFTDYTKAFDCVNHDKLWKALREIGKTDHLTCFLKNLCVGQEAIVRTLYGKTDWFKKGV